MNKQGELDSHLMLAGLRMVERVEHRVIDVLINGIPEKTEEEKLRDKLKYAKVLRDGQETITFLNNETMESYLIENDDWYGGNLVTPLTKDTRPFTFIRWCTGFDF